MATIIFRFEQLCKYLSWSLLILARKIVAWHDFGLASCRKDRVRVEFTFTREIVMLQCWPLFMCANPNGVKFKRQFTAISFPFHLPSMTFRVLDSHKKETFPLKMPFLGESQRPVRRFFNQISSFRLKTN